MLTAACRHKDDGDVLARAYDHYLRVSDIEGLVGDGVSPEDSAAIVSNYINQWVQQMVVLEKARKNVKNDFSKELTDYKNNLITYEYERLIIEQLLDTNVSPKEVEEYFAAHQSNFTLKNSIVRAIYVKMPKNAPSGQKIRPIFRKPALGDEDLDQIQKFASVDAAAIHLNQETWINFYDLQSVVPIETYNESVFLRSTKNLEVSDAEYVYFLRILDYKVQDEISPLEHEYDNIRTIILNHRKIDIIKNMQRSLLEKAAAAKEIEIL